MSFWLRLSCSVLLLPVFAFAAHAAVINVPGDQPTIQDAVNAAAPTGDIVLVAAGTYVEQVVINGKELTIQGAGPGSTIVQAPAVLATTFTTSGPNKPVVTATNSADVRLIDVTVDGLGQGNANPRIVGVGFWNAGGKVLGSSIVGIRNTPLDGAQAGVAVLSSTNTGGPYALEIGDCSISDFQKNGMALTGNVVVNVHDCSVTGAGDITVNAQNGIQVGPGSSGAVTACAISAIRFTPASAVASGLLVFGTSGPVTVSGLTGSNAITDVQAPVSWYDGSGSINGIEVAGTIVPGADFGPIFVLNQSSSAPNARARLHTAGRPSASPVDGEGSAGALARAPDGLLASYSVTITNGCLDGSDVAGTVGVYAATNGGPLSVSVTNCNLSDWDVALVADGAATSLSATDNSITSSIIAGYDNTLSGAAQDADDNWWGAADGPGGAGPGSGDAIAGVAVDFSPWLISGTDTNPSCGFQPVADNPVTPGPVPSCLSTVNTCVLVPVKIQRSDSAPIRGFSIDIQLSANLTLCGAGITSGGHLANPNFHVIDNGGGSYTVDEATLGLPCGATGDGTLFDVRVASASPGGTGTITVTSVTLRDCANVAVPGSAGPAASITIDNVAPLAVAMSAATQQTTGNTQPPNGTTNVLVSWTGQEVGASIAVYRKGFGGYPQYDEVPGTGAPAAPATPLAAAGAGWTLTGVTTAGGADRTGARDFYYYVAFVTDPCGNVSAVSNRTGGTLNYHLGDVHDGAVNCAGNDLVNTSDMTFFGANYGAIVPVSGALECLDVGPTTDFSVNARPTTDNEIQFEDLMMYAINFGQVSAPQARIAPVAAATDRLQLRVPPPPGVGETFDVTLEFAGTGAVQGLSAELAWDAAVVEPVGVEGAALLAVQGTPGVVLSARAGNVDVALLGPGAGLRGSGDLARVRFRVKAAGEARIALAAVDARDAGNRRLTLDQPTPVSSVVPERSGLSAARPNPFTDRAVLECALARDGDVSLGIYGIDGRRIRTLAKGALAAGVHRFVWDGRDEAGREVAAGMFYARLDTGDGRFRRTLVRVR